MGVSYLRDWMGSVADAETTLHKFKVTLQLATWDPVPSKKFHAMLREMREQGLDGWLDSHPLDCDKLYEAVTGEADAWIPVAPLPYWEGYHAHKADILVCPYDGGTQAEAYEAWCEGWDAAGDETKEES